MASQSQDLTPIEEAYANMNIDEEDDVESDLIVAEDAIVETELDYCFCLVGQFLTDSSIHFDSISNLLASIWKPVKGGIHQRTRN